jgi:A/G-specific adenine glycosylase
MIDHLTLERLAHLRSSLLAWYDRQRRDLPWRDEPDPYRVWVSEVMLQQTQVTTVIPYYERFLRRFPRLADLAAASLDEVLKVWEGLGYYARARHLHAAARRVMADYGGQLPANYASLRRLPGLGDYTAGALASIAFGERVPAVDGNVKRVLARLFAVSRPVGEGATARRLRAAAAELTPPDRPGDFNQALMELGATLCLPAAPRCLLCPVQAECAGLAQGIQESLPAKSPHRTLPHYDVTAGVIRRDDGCLLIAQRKPEAMLGGLWEFPGGKCRPGETLPDCLRREIREELDVEIEVGRQLTTIRHGYTHFRISLHVFECRYLRGEPQALDCADWRWVGPDRLADFAFPVTDQKIIQTIAASPAPAKPPTAHAASR